MAKAVKPAKPQQPKNKGGRPPKLTDDERTIGIISGLAKIQCTNAEAAAVLNVSRETFEQFLGRSKKAREAWQTGKEAGKASLRRMQFRAAEEGNTTMLIWLGKQFLGQRDKHETEITGKDGGPIETKQTLDLSKMTDDELEAYRTLASASRRHRAGDQPASVH